MSDLLRAHSAELPSYLRPTHHFGCSYRQTTFILRPSIRMGSTIYIGGDYRGDMVGIRAYPHSAHLINLIHLNKAY